MTLSKDRSITSIEFLILLALLLTPIFTIQESLALIFLDQRQQINTSNTITSTYIKALKDLFFIIIILMSFLIIAQSLSVKRNTLRFLGVILFLILLPAYYYHTNILVYLSGIRWLLPFILAAFLFGHIDRNLLQKMGTIMFYIFIAHFLIQILQFLFSYGYYGLNSFGLSGRNPGIFYVPSTAAVFVLMVLFFSKFYMKKSLEKKISYLIPISILLTASGTGVGVYIIFFTVYYLRGKYIRFMPVILIFIGITLLLVLDYYPGRSGLVEDSLGARYMHVKEALVHATLLPEYFGYGTATAELINNKFNSGFILPRTDSFYASLIVNLGLINFSLIVIGLFILFVRLTGSHDKGKLIFFMICSSIALTTSITESYPMNLILAVHIAYYLNPKEQNKRLLST